MGKKGIAGLVGLALVVILGLVAWTHRIWIVLHLPMKTEPVGAHRDIAWQGPDAPAARQRPPNVIVILADDLGYNDVSFNGGGVAGVLKTPNIDAIGHEGVSFTNGYAGNATCAPSRAAIMTGRYPTRFGFEFTPTPLQFTQVVGHFPYPDHPGLYHKELEKQVPPFEQMGVPTSEITIAQALQAQGYHTIHLGKWHLGETRQFQPQNRGFDESLGFLSGASMYRPRTDTSVENSKQDFDPIDQFLWARLGYGVRYNGSALFDPGAYMTDYLTANAVKAIHANRNRPFFLYLAYNAPHTPLQATKADYDALSNIKDHRTRVYAAMVRALDRGVGQVMAQLKADGLDDNTLVVFTSDNGGAHYIGLPEINKPYRGWKASFFEGGIHAPYFMRWPGKIAAGSTYGRPVSHFDIFATAMDVAGGKMPTDRAMDGVDLLPYLSGKASGDPHKALFWRSGPYVVVRAGDWKLQVAPHPGRTWLFDLAADPTEKTDLSKARPDKVAELSAMIADFQKQQAKPLWPAVMEGPISIDHPLGVKGSPSETYIEWAN